jgi:tetrahydromethanopterin S-methyltransferase subunit B
MTPTNSKPYEILTGVGDLYIAALGATFPAVDAVPGAAWRHLGYTQDGLTIKMSQKIEKINVDQETGAVKAARSEESMTIETNLAESTLENLADHIGTTVTDVAPGAGTIGTREVGHYRSGYVKTFAVLFRGTSAYGNYPAQTQIPVCYIDGDIEQKFDKSKNPVIKVAFEALVDPDAASDVFKFGKTVMQDGIALT